MTRIQISILLFVLYAIMGVAMDGGLRPFMLMTTLSCAPLLLHWALSREGKESSHG